MTAKVGTLTIPPGDTPSVENLSQFGVYVTGGTRARFRCVVWVYLREVETEDLIEFRWLLDEHLRRLQARGPRDHRLGDPLDAHSREKTM